MKAVILAGGFGTRLAEETDVRPKPMVKIGEKPILWHIMKIYSAHGINDFIVCCGYKGYVIKEYFANYFYRTSDITFDIQNNTMEVHRRSNEPWTVTLIDTGLETMTGGRVKRIREHLDEETFCLTYGDGVSDVDITGLIDFHRQQDAVVTLTAVQPPGRFGAFNLEPDSAKIETFREKPQGGPDGAWVNGGFFVCEPEAIDYVEGDDTVWEHGPLVKLSQANKLAAFRHEGFWQPMDTLRDKNVLESLWKEDGKPWKVW